MRYLVALLLYSVLSIGCSSSMSPREMISDCIAEIIPISFVMLISNQDLKDNCYSKYRTCLVACYLETKECGDAHEEAIDACEEFKQNLRSK
jgi:hypothetical protein